MRRVFALLTVLIAGVTMAAQCPDINMLTEPVTGTPSTQTSTGDSVLMPKTMCTVLALAFFDANFLACQHAQTMDANLVEFARSVGTDKDDTPSAQDFAPLTSYLGTPPQLHETDGSAIVLAFVAAPGLAHVAVDNGLITDRQGFVRGHSWDCGAAGGVAYGDDPDCIPGLPAYAYNGAIAFALVPDPAGSRGAGTITVTQGATTITIPFMVVGEADSVTVTIVEPAVLAGLGGGTDNASQETLRPPTADPAQQCVFPAGGAQGLVEAAATTERTIALATVKDSDGTAIIGAFVRWQSDNPEIGTSAMPLVPTLDTGTLGYVAPNLMCGTAGGGSITLTVTTAPMSAIGFPVDPAAPETSATAPLLVLQTPCLPLVCTPSPTPTLGAPTSTPTNTATRTSTSTNTPTITPTLAPCQPACTPTTTPSPVPTATTTPSPDEIRVASAAANGAVPLDANFTVTLAVSASTTPYKSIQWELAYGGNISFVSDVYSCSQAPISFPNESETEPVEDVGATTVPSLAPLTILGGGSNCGSLNASYAGSNGLATFVTVTLKCVSEGTAPVFAVSTTSDPGFGTALGDRDGAVITTGLAPQFAAGATFGSQAGFNVTCGGASNTSTATPTATNTPTATPTSNATDVDGDGCPDERELGAAHLTGGQRDPNNGNDFFDVPVPVLLTSNTTGARNRVIAIADVIAVVAYIGTSAANPDMTNPNSAKYGSDLNNNGTPDGQEYDRIPGGVSGQPWRSGAPDGAVTIADAIVGLNQIGDNCS